ncbi:recombinase family protein [Mesorhizobium sp. M0016]|uniref:recombinase family protein n=1 Tax=Mesorhizobium sp. M0016 TaxID=2956843 RepID=UPI00333D5D9A
MTEHSKVTAGHLARQAIVYLRQSTPSQVENNRESTARQYALPGRARELGWPDERIVVIDEDLGLSGTGVVMRDGFARLTSEVALARVGIVLGLEVSRLARNNADWHRLIELAGLTETLIGDADGIYHPALFNDRLLLGLKGAMSEAELHVLRARLDGGIRNKAARGELRRGLPIGFVWGEADGEILIHPDEAVANVIHTIFARFAELGSARRVWLWLRAHGMKFPLSLGGHHELRWSEASYHAVHSVLASPVYAGAYVYGKNRRETVLDETGARRKRIRKLPMDEWQVLIKDHHKGYIDWPTFEANQQRMAANTHPRPHAETDGGSGGAVREGGALLQGIARCGHCGRRLRTHYRGRNAAPGYHCAGKVIAEGRGVYCLNVGGVQIDQAVVAAFLEALEPVRLAATLEAAERLENDREAALKQWRLERPRVLSAKERESLIALGADLASVWHAPTTTARDRKELLRTLIEEVTLEVDRDKAAAHLVLRWKGGALSRLDVALPRSRPATVRTDEDTLALLRRLAPHYPNAVIAGVLNHQGRRTAYGYRFDANRVSSLRRHWKIPACKAKPPAADGDIVTVRQAAAALGVAPSTLHRHINDGLIQGEQITPGAPWRIRLTAELKARFLATPGDGFEPVRDAIETLGLSRQSLLQRIKRGELDAVHIVRGQRKGLWINTIDHNPTLFEHTS